MGKILHALMLFFFTGCAIQSPMSEMLMFQQKESLEGKKYKARYSHSILGFTANLYSPHVVNSYTENKNPTGKDTNYDYKVRPKILTQAIFISDKSSRFAASVAIGNSIGFDATAKIYKNVFLSGALSFYDDIQEEMVLQRRIFDGNPVGLSIGLIFQRNHQYVAIDGFDCSLCFPKEEFYTNSIGVRFVGLFSQRSIYGQSREFLHVTGSLNYDMNINTMYPKIGFAFGLY